MPVGCKAQILLTHKKVGKMHKVELGDCFELSANFMIDTCCFDEEKQKAFRLVHGKPTLTVPPYIQYGHAWILLTDTQVLDLTIQRSAPKDRYYAKGRIKEEDCFVYTFAEMKALVNKTGHLGPWDLVESDEEKQLREELSECI